MNALRRRFLRQCRQRKIGLKCYIFLCIFRDIRGGTLRYSTPIVANHLFFKAESTIESITNKMIDDFEDVLLDYLSGKPEKALKMFAETNKWFDWMGKQEPEIQILDINSLC